MSNLFDKKDVYSWSNLEDAKKYIGEEGYFCETCHESLALWHKGLLRDVNQSMPVDCIFEDAENEVFGLFLPADKVKEVKEEKKWRPFKNLEEFKTELNGIEYGDVVRFREKSDHAIKLYGGYLGHSEKDGQLLALALGAFFYSPEKLFEDYEWQDKEGNWQIFGVEE